METQSLGTAALVPPHAGPARALALRVCLGFHISVCKALPARLSLHLPHTHTNTTGCACIPAWPSEPCREACVGAPARHRCPMRPPWDIPSSVYLPLLSRHSWLSKNLTPAARPVHLWHRGAAAGRRPGWMLCQEVHCHAVQTGCRSYG